MGTKAAPAPGQPPQGFCVCQQSREQRGQLPQPKDSGGWQELCPSSFPGCLAGLGREASVRWDSLLQPFFPLLLPPFPPLAVPACLFSCCQVTPACFPEGRRRGGGDGRGATLLGWLSSRALGLGPWQEPQRSPKLDEAPVANRAQLDPCRIPAATCSPSHCRSCLAMHSG